MSIFGKEKVAVYIDGSNTYNKLKKLGLPDEDKRFDFSAFVSHVVSSDTDLIPAIKYARYKKKNVEYVGFAGEPSLGMIKECGSQRLFVKEDLLPFQYLKEAK